jgi:hypothetical protein
MRIDHLWVTARPDKQNFIESFARPQTHITQTQNPKSNAYQQIVTRKSLSGKHQIQKQHYHIISNKGIFED